MRRIAWIAPIACLCLAMAGPALADGAKKSAEEVAAPTVTQGEIVDLGCYLGHGAKGAEHKACATKCINGGMPMGLLAQDGTLYLLTMSHEDADPFNSAKQMAAEQVKVTGPMHEKDGMKSIEVTSIEPAAKPAAKS